MCVCDRGEGEGGYVHSVVFNYNFYLQDLGFRSPLRSLNTGSIKLKFEGPTVSTVLYILTLKVTNYFSPGGQEALSIWKRETLTLDFT